MSRNIDDLDAEEYVLGVERMHPDAYNPEDPTHLSGDENPTRRPVRMIAKFGAGEGRDAGHWERSDSKHELIFTDELSSSGRKKAFRFIEGKFNVNRRPLR